METKTNTYSPAITHADIPTPMITNSTGSGPQDLHTLLLTTVDLQLITSALIERRRERISLGKQHPRSMADLSALTDAMTGLYRAVIGDGASHVRP